MTLRFNIYWHIWGLGPQVVFPCNKPPRRLEIWFALGPFSVSLTGRFREATP